MNLKKNRQKKSAENLAKLNKAKLFKKLMKYDNFVRILDKKNWQKYLYSVQLNLKKYSETHNTYDPILRS
jgi:hypothetical protein